VQPSVEMKHTNRDPEKQFHQKQNDQKENEIGLLRISIEPTRMRSIVH